MEFEWDESKNDSNYQKHGVWFDDAMYVFEEPILERVDAREDYGETRFECKDTVDGRVLVVVYTWRGKICRLISARKANKREQRAYYKALPRIAPEPDS